MQFQLASAFKVQVEATAQKMVNDNMDVCEIPEGLGMMLVRVGSDEYRRRRDADSHSMIMPLPISVDTHVFFVCTC
jgi:hypothetical protein